MLKHDVNIKWEYPPEYEAESLKALDTALDRVDFYRSWRSLDPGPDHPVDVRFAALPALTKKEIRENSPAGMLPAERDIRRGIADGEIQLVETSGTTDDKITNVWNQKWWDASERASWKLSSVMTGIATGIHREAILVNPKNVGVRSDEADLPMEKRRLDRFLYLNEKGDPLAWSDGLMDRMVWELNLYRPDVLEANPSYLARLCRYVAASRRTVFQPGAIVFTYEYPTDLHRLQIGRVFRNVPMVSSYGSTETGYVFMQCEAGRFHQNSAFCRVDFQPLTREHGGPHLGRILVTPFGNPWCYFLRFDTGDIVGLEESGECPCGRNSGLILSSIAGRKINLTMTTGGRLVTLLELDGAMDRVEGVEMYSLTQKGPHTYELHLAGRQPDEAGAAAALRELYGQRAEIAVILENDIAPEASGKYLVSRTLFPIDLERYLDGKISTGRG